MIIFNLLHGLWNPEVQCRIHKRSPIVPILDWINPIPSTDIYFKRFIIIFFSHLHLCLLKGLFPVLGYWKNKIKPFMPYSYKYPSTHSDPNLEQFYVFRLFWHRLLWRRKGLFHSGTSLQQREISRSSRVLTICSIHRSLCCLNMAALFVSRYRWKISSFFKYSPFWYWWVFSCTEDFT